jgi:putative oxidoreductase
MTIVRFGARPLLASMFLAGGLDAVLNAKKRADAAEPVTDRLAPLLQKAVPQLPDDPTTLVRLNGAVQVVAALALATGRAPRISSALLAGSLVPTTFVEHRFWEEDEPQAKANQRIHFFKNCSVLGGLLLAAVHRGHAGRRVACSPRHRRRTPRCAAAGQDRTSRGQARPGAADLTSMVRKAQRLSRDR